MKRITTFSKAGNEKGSMLIISFLIILILITLGAAIITLATNEKKVVERQRLTNQALYIAEAGIERAIYDLRQDFLLDVSSPSWADGNINGYASGPDTAAFYSLPYASTSMNNGSYSVQLKNVSGNKDIWIKSTGTIGDTVQTIQVYVKMYSVSPWDNAIFAGAGAAGAMVNGNVNIRGSVHILGTGLASTDYAIDLGGTAELIGNNYNGLDSSLLAKVPALPTVTFGGETVSTLGAELRIKRGRVGLSGSSTAGDANVTGNAVKETIDGSYVTDGFGGSSGTSSVYSDNGWSNGYDLGDTLTFPSLSTPYGGYGTYQEYLRNNALVLTNQLSSIDPTSSFSYSNANGSISMDGSGNMTISGIVYLDANNNLGMVTSGSDKTITYTGEGSILVTGNAQINVNLVTAGNNSYPNNILGIMTPNQIGFNEANIDVMGLFYAETSVVVQKQTDIMGTIVSNYFDMGTNVPSIFKVPEVVNNLPPGLIGQNAAWVMMVISWQKI